MTKLLNIFCTIIMANIQLLNATSIPIRPIIPTTYKPSILKLPPGFDSQKPPQQPMLYPFALSPSPTRPSIKKLPATTPGWIPLALNSQHNVPSVSHPYSSTTPTLSSRQLPILEDRISQEKALLSSTSNNEGHVFESIVYGTWKPDPPLEPVKMVNGTKQHQHHHHHQSNSNNISSGLIVDGKLYNKTINRQNGGFIGRIHHRPTKADRQNQHQNNNHKSSSTSLTTSFAVEQKSKESPEISSEQKLQTKIKKQGRRKIRPISSTTEQNSSIERSPNGDDKETTTTKANLQHQEIVNLMDPKLMEVVKQFNESIEIKYNHKQTSTHSIDMTTAKAAETEPEAESEANDDYGDDDGNDELSVLKSQLNTKSAEFMSTEPQPYYEDDDTEDGEVLENISATRRSWPSDFMDEPLITTETNKKDLNESFSNGFATDPLEIPLVLKALNIPPSLWPKFPGNITKLGKPFETKSSAEESALCVPITVQEQNMASSKELVFIERVFCFPKPPSSSSTLMPSTSENSLSTLTSSTFSSTTLSSVTRAKVQSYDDFIDSNLRVLNISSSKNNFKLQFYLVLSILVIYFNYL